MRSALRVLSLSTRAPQTAMILSSSSAAAAATHGAGSICGSVTGSVPVAQAWYAGAAHSTDASATLRIRPDKPSRINLSRASLSIFRYCNERSKRQAVRTTVDFGRLDRAHFGARLPAADRQDPPTRTPGFDDIRMADCLAAWRGAAVGAGPADQGALPDLSRHWRHAAGLCAIGPVLDAGARSGAGAVRGTGAAGCRLRHVAARPPRQLAAGLDAGIHRGRGYYRRGGGARPLVAAGHAVGGSDCARRHRGAAGCRRGDGDPAPGQPALPDFENPR